MCVTVLANLTFGELQRRAGTGNVPNDPLSAPIYFNFEKEIIPFFNSQWENLTSMTRRSLSVTFVQFTFSRDGFSCLLRVSYDATTGLLLKNVFWWKELV